MNPGETYKWRVRVTDSSQWLKTQNGTNTAWHAFTMASTPEFGADSAALTNSYWNMSRGDKLVYSSTGLGPYSGCLKARYMNTSNGDEDIHYLAPDLGPVKEVWSDGGENGWELGLRSLDL